MILQIGGYRFPNFDVRVEDVSYNPMFDIFRRPTTIQETWQISGRLVYGYSVTGSDAQAAMTGGINSLRATLLSFYRQNVVLFHDDGVTESAYKMLAGDFLDGPEISAHNWPSNDAAVYSASAPYRFTITGTRFGQLSSSGIIEFSETLQNTSGGTIVGHVGGALGFAERQILMEQEPWAYVQQGSAVGLLGYPLAPGPIYPAFRTKPRRYTLKSPRKLGTVPMEFEIQWTDEYEHSMALPNAEPHIFI